MNRHSGEGRNPEALLVAKLRLFNRRVNTIQICFENGKDTTAHVLVMNSSFFILKEMAGMAESGNHLKLQ